MNIRKALVLFVSLCAAAVTARAEKTAAGIFEATGVRGGLVVKIGCGDGIAPASLRKNDSFLVLAVDDDPAKVAAARQSIRSAGAYGPVTAERFDGRHLPCADDMAALVVAADPGAVTAAEITRVLRPGGKAYVAAGNTWKLTTRPRPEEIDEWTHYLHDASNDGTAADVRVGPPARMRWKCGPMWSRSHEYTSSLIAMVSAAGRIFYIFDEGLTGVTPKFLPEKWTLTARDAFSGVLLWKKPLASFRGGRWNNRSLRGVPPWVRRLLVAAGDRLFLTPGLDEPVAVLDGATGSTLATCAGTTGARELRCCDGVLLVHMGAKGIIAFEAASGKQLWRHDGRPAEKTLAAQDGKVYYLQGTAVACLDLQTGKQLWQSTVGTQETAGMKKKKRRGAALLIACGDVILAATRGEIVALNASDGSKTWSTRTRLGGRGELFATGGKAWRWEGHTFAAHDLATGDIVKTVDPSAVFTPGHHLRCYQGKATTNYIITPYRGVEFVAITGKKHVQNDWVRGPCTYGIMPANGLLYAPPHPCFCYPGAKLYGFNALAPETPGDRRRSASPRFEKGPAWDDAATLADEKTAAGDWPMYRHDQRRTGATAAAVPADVAAAWNVELKGELTPPVAAGGRVYVAQKDTNILFALDAGDGSPAWTFVAGGRLDSPPTVLGGLVLFGAADGHVYCLRAADGAPAWRFRAAPSDRRIVDENRLESPWPAHGSVLPYNGTIYCTAGRSTFLDGGIRVFGLDPKTGAVRHETVLDTRERTREDAKDKPFVPAYHMEGSLSDILVCENDHLYMCQHKLDLSLAPQECPYVIPKEGDGKVQTMDLSGKPWILEDMKKVQKLEVHQRRWLENAAKKTVAALREQHGAFNIGHRRMGRHLLGNFGLLDDSWFNRTFWMYAETWPGFYIGHIGAKTGQILVVGPEKTYAVQAYPYRNMQSPLFTPGEKGYLLLADDNDNEPALQDQTRETTKGWGFTRTAPPVWHRWVSVLVRSMTLAGDRLFVAGPPDVVVDGDPMASYEGRAGGVLMAVSADDGTPLSELKLESMPVFDGLIAANGSLYLSTTDGRVIKFGKK